MTIGDAIFEGSGKAILGGRAKLTSRNGLIRITMSQVASAAEKMIEVESLAEIDPAIFSDVTNYFYPDISVLLPWDQVYGEESEEL